MTREEHQLMVTMFTIQRSLIFSLADILKSHDLTSDDDLVAFETLQKVEAVSRLGLARQVQNEYVSHAQGLSLEIGLERLP